MGHRRAFGIAVLLFASAWADDSCTDSNNGALSGSSLFGCSDDDTGSSYGAIYGGYYGYNYCGYYDDDDFSSDDMCCDCGGGASPSPAPTFSFPPSMSGQPSPVPIPAPTPTCVDMDYSGQAGSPTYYTCATYPTWCPSYYHDDDFSADDMCCSCGGGGVFGQLPSPIPTITRRPTPAPTTCTDGNNGATGSTWSGTFTCDQIPSYCPTYYNDDDFTSGDMCCDCGGGYFDGKIPSPVPTPGSPEPTVTLTPTPGPTTCTDGISEGSYGRTCDTIPSSCPTWYNDDDFSSDVMCCDCGGGYFDGKIPSPAPTLTLAPTPAPTPAPTISCIDTDFSATDSWNDNCASWYIYASRCTSSYDDYDFTAYDLCCTCGGGMDRTPPPTTPVPTPAPSLNCAADTYYSFSYADLFAPSAFIYRLKMTDAGGDGWEGATYSIFNSSSLGTTIDEESGAIMLASGTLADGSEAFDWLCLPDGCYELIVSGGTESDLEEIGFEFIDEIGGHFQDLTAPYADHFCVAAGDVFDHPTASPTISVSPTALPVPEPTISAAPTAFTSAPTISVNPSPAPTAAPTKLPSPAPTPSPTPSPTRTPVVAISVGVSGIACADFNGTVYNLALGSLLNATFSAPVCTDLADTDYSYEYVSLFSDSAVQVDNEATVSLVDLAAYGSAYALVVDVLNKSVATGSFTSAIVTFATQLGERRLSTEAAVKGGGRRRLSMSAASVDSVSVDTFSPTPAPTETPTTPPSPAPTISPSPAPTTPPSPAPSALPTEVPVSAPTAVPVSAPTTLPTAVPVPAPTTLPTSFPTSKPMPLPTPTPTSAPMPLPSFAPTALPTVAPTPDPTALPVSAPTTTPTVQPTPLPSAIPTLAPTHISASSSAGIATGFALGAAVILVCGVGVVGTIGIMASHPDLSSRLRETV